ncbi:Aspartic peptidase protein [Actinidia chinensis var. chinensis]|uniref:Aspartic peptidase protein n=1 Tax=Actinidia chinensis var. chinensis TaxID=1590841 RepID=A0A2R6PK46_ACTCC|nr:Aspartic peptidase protein [Actinidia chinensis var. chinensis]
MASTSHLSLLLLSLLLLTTTAPATAKSPRALFLLVLKDYDTLQYTAFVAQRTPLVAVKLTIDLGGRSMWVDCDQGFNSSSDRKVGCSTPLCQISGSRACSGNTCSLTPDNRFTRTATSGDLVTDAYAIQSTDGSNPRRVVSIRRFPFTCGTTSLLQGLDDGVQGMAGLGITNISMPAQFASAFRFPKIFAVCLSSSTGSHGIIFFGDGPYVLKPNVDVSKPLTYTPLIINPVSTASAFPLGEASADYFIGVTSVRINNKIVPLNKTLLSIDEAGRGGTRFSTVNPYTVMETSIYKAFTRTFVEQLSGATRVASVAPFEFCYKSNSFAATQLGPRVPRIDLVLQSTSVFWSIFGANSMVAMRHQDVLCLGFVDGGVDPISSIVIGGHQIDDNLLQFDLARLRLGFSSSLLSRKTTCSDFNLTIID